MTPGNNTFFVNRNLLVGVLSVGEKASAVELLAIIIIIFLFFYMAQG